MQWSYHLCSTITATTSKFKMAVEIGVFRLIREALYFCSTITATTSKFCWELQIDVSIIYSFSYTHVFKGKKCNESIICILGSQQLPQNSKWPPFWSKLAFWDLTLIREALYFCGSYKLTGKLIAGFMNDEGVSKMLFFVSKGLKSFIVCRI